ncbi:hypothetical protein [Mycobacterium botniense]|uniref:Uncharacterized protein n=1 Tax=Mycobacterium botniense TaxID=84962 RepID=A0A7I9XXY7_9MYCO|nr:hypothetical protein [Mycobacterium botniense]GFG74656.1 hypothetical protein MBOT_20210 [Mycobacterium botniense]
MPVYLDVKSRLDVAAAQLAAREAKAIFSRAGDDIGRGLGGALTRALSAIDGSAARAALRGLQDEYRAAAAAEEEAARMRSMGQVEVAQKRLNETTAKYGADSSKAAAANVALADMPAHRKHNVITSMRWSPPRPRTAGSAARWTRARPRPAAPARCSTRSVSPP